MRCATFGMPIGWMGQLSGLTAVVAMEVSEHAILLQRPTDCRPIAKHREEPLQVSDPSTKGLRHLPIEVW